MYENVFRILAIAIFIVGAAISSSFRRKAEKNDSEKISLMEEGMLMTVVLRILGLSTWGGVFAYMINPNWMKWSSIDLPDVLRWIGVMLGILGDLLAYWVFSNLGNNVTPTVVTRRSAQLITSGPYRWVRHPLYLMGFIGYAGFALLAENWFIALMAALVFGVLVIRTEKEEINLIEKFGSEYRKYMEQTGRFFPKFN
jgi:protein-S-isoprenylcysteine O-methyltransferase Ste14